MAQKDLLIRQARLSLPIVQSVSDRISTPNLSELPEPDKLKSLAGEIRQHTLDHLDHYLEQLRTNVARNGGIFSLAATAESARSTLIETLASENCRAVRREPSALCDEIGFTPGLVISGYDALVTGANFAIAATGQVCICRAEPLPATTRVLVCVLGIESILPRLADLAVMLKLLARSSLGRPMTVSTELLGASPPQRFHLILVDNGRRKILDSEHRQVLRCIGCDACSAVCPVYQKIRNRDEIGRAGPISAMLSPLMKGTAKFDRLPFASTLCGACSQVCPVGIDLPAQLQRLREVIVNQRRTGWRDRIAHRLRARALMSVARYRRRRWIARPLGITADAPPPAPRSFRDLWKAKR